MQGRHRTPRTLGWYLTRGIVGILGIAALVMGGQGLVEMAFDVSDRGGSTQLTTRPSPLSTATTVGPTGYLFGGSDGTATTTEDAAATSSSTSVTPGTPSTPGSGEPQPVSTTTGSTPPPATSSSSTTTTPKPGSTKGSAPWKTEATKKP